MEQESKSEFHQRGLQLQKQICNRLRADFSFGYACSLQPPLHSFASWNSLPGQAGARLLLHCGLSHLWAPSLGWH
jgi:hypothetical protein